MGSRGKCLAHPHPSSPSSVTVDKSLGTLNSDFSTCKMKITCISCGISNPSVTQQM